jgi:hypothetical protein
MAPTTNKQWRLNGFTGFDSIVLKNGTILSIGDSDVLVRWKYASLNYRDLVIAKVRFASTHVDFLRVIPHPQRKGGTFNHYCRSFVIPWFWLRCIAGTLEKPSLSA